MDLKMTVQTCFSIPAFNCLTFMVRQLNIQTFPLKFRNDPIILIKFLCYVVVEYLLL